MNGDCDLPNRTGDAIGYLDIDMGYSHYQQIIWNRNWLEPVRTQQPPPEFSELPPKRRRLRSPDGKSFDAVGVRIAS